MKPSKISFCDEKKPSVEELAKELFTHRGSGTLVKLGEKVQKYTKWDEIDLPRLRTLIESSFGRSLVDDYFERTKLFRAYISENYRAATQ